VNHGGCSGINGVNPESMDQIAVVVALELVTLWRHCNGDPSISVLVERMRHCG